MNEKKAGQLVEKFRRGPNNVRFGDLKKLIEHYFGKGESHGTSHFVWATGFQDDPLVNIQNDKGKAKPYQVRQVLKLIERKIGEKNARKSR